MIKDKIQEINNLKKELTNKSLRRIIELIHDENESVKLLAIESLTYFYSFTKAKKALCKLTNDSNSEVRYYSVEALASFSGIEVEECIIQRLSDQDELVRIQAIETLGDLKSQKSVCHLKESLSDKSEYVRVRAAEVLGLLGNVETINLLKEALRREKTEAALLGFYLGLYWLYQRHYLDLIINMFNSEIYTVRCAVANSILDLVNLQNKEMIVKILQDKLLEEKTVAVKSSILDALDDLGEKPR